MKTFLKFSGAISAVLALVTFILLMATPAVIYSENVLGTSTEIAGASAIFGTEDYGPSWAGLLSWIFVLISLLILVAGVVLPLVKVKGLEKVAGVLNLVAVLLLIVSGVFIFCEVPAFVAAAGDASFNIGGNSGGYGLGAGWVFSAIFSLAAGAIAVLPTVMGFISKK